MPFRRANAPPAASAGWTAASANVQVEAVQTNPGAGDGDNALVNQQPGDYPGRAHDHQGHPGPPVTEPCSQAPSRGIETNDPGQRGVGPQAGTGAAGLGAD